MKALAIMYHDVVENGDYAASGFAGKGADIDKLGRRDFAVQLEAMRPARAGAVMLTFDDGSVIAYAPIAGMLEQHGWRGYSFVTTYWIDRTGFLDAEQIQELDRRGHVVGSHSCSTHTHDS